MKVIIKEDVITLIEKGEKQIIYTIQPDMIERFQLLLAGAYFRKVEFFGYDPQELRGLAFMVAYSDLINLSVQNNYRVFVVREGSKLSKGEWYLIFEIKNE